MKFALLAIATCSLATGPAIALQVRTYSPASHDRFTGFPSAPVANPAFLHAGLDLTGVGWDAALPTRQFTLVSPRHFVGAYHYPPAIGTEIRFLSADGTMRITTVESLHAVPSPTGQATDLLVGRLSAPVLPSSGVKFLRCHILDSEAGYVGQTLGVLGQSARGGRGTIAATGTFGGDGASGINMTRTLQFNYSTLAGNPNDCHVEVGDSGSPSFVAVNGFAALVGTHTARLSAAGNITTVDTLVPAYVAQVNTIMEADGYHFTPAAPKLTTLAMTQQTTPAVPRAGYPVTITFSLANTGANPANNVKLDTTMDGIMGISGDGGPGWVVENGAESQNARRGGLAAGGAGQVSLTFTPATSGTFARTTKWSADETAVGTDTGTVTVVESFKSWSAGLTNATPDGDDDADGFANLLEYSQGGNPHAGSRTVEETSQPMGLISVRSEPAAGGHRQVVRFVRRTDAPLRLLDYRLEVTSTFSTWDDVTTQATELSRSPLKPGFETVDVALPATQDKSQFAHLRIVLTE